MQYVIGVEKYLFNSPNLHFVGPFMLLFNAIYVSTDVTRPWEPMEAAGNMQVGGR